MNLGCRGLIVVSALAIATGCNGRSLLQDGPAIEGSGVAAEENRPVESFHALKAGNALQVTVALSKDAKPGLKISGDDNLVPLVESTLSEGTLTLRIKDDLNTTPKLPLLVEVTASELDLVDAAGVSQIKVSGGSKVARFTAEASGAAGSRSRDWKRLKPSPARVVPRTLCSRALLSH